MNFKKLNTPLLRKVRDAVDDENNAFDMNQWGVLSFQNTWWHANDDGDEGTAACGTPACIAGWTIMLSLEHVDEPPTNDPDQNPAHLAADLLGLETDPLDLEDHPLFWAARWPEKQRMNWTKSDKWARDSAVELLDMMLDGVNPWAV